MTATEPATRTLPDVTVDLGAGTVYVHPREHGADPYGPLELRDAYHLLADGWDLPWAVAVVYADRPMIEHHNRRLARELPALSVAVDRMWGGYAYLCAGGLCHRSGGWDSPGGAAMNARVHRSSSECRYKGGHPYDRVRFKVRHQAAAPSNLAPDTVFMVDGSPLGHRVALDRAVEMCGDAQAGRDLIVVAQCAGYTRSAPGMLSVEASKVPHTAESVCADGACAVGVHHFPGEVYTDALNHLESGVCRARPKVVRDGPGYRIEGAPVVDTRTALSTLKAAWRIGEPFASGLLYRAPVA